MGIKKENLKVRNKTMINTVLSMTGSILIRAVDLISIPIFTRILDTASYGRVSVFTTYVQILTIILSLDIYGCVGRATQEYKEKKEQFYSVTIFFSMIWTAFILILCNIFSPTVSYLLTMSRLEYNILILYGFASFIIIYKSAELIFTMQYQCNIFISLCVALGNLGLSALFVLTLFSDDKFLGRILGAALPTLLMASIAVYGYLRRGRKLFDREYLLYALKFGIPLIPHNLSHLVLSSSDRIMIQSMVGDSPSGIYSLTYNVGLMMQVITEGANNAWNPLLFRRLEDNKRPMVRRQARIYLVAYSLVAIGVIAISPEIIKVVAAKGYWEGINLVMWICLSTYYTFVYQLFVNVEFYHKRTALISLGTIMAAMVNIGLNLYGIPIWGYEFAAISTVISYGILVIFHCIILNCIIKDRVIDTVFTLSVAVLMLGFTCVFYHLRYRIGLRFAMLCLIETMVLALLYFMYRREKNCMY